MNRLCTWYTGHPKVFFKYFYVNTATGEKSGEKMASVVLASE